MQVVLTNRVATESAKKEAFLAQDVGSFRRRLIESDAEICPDALPIREDDYHRRLRNILQASQDACRRFEQENSDNPDLIGQTRADFRQETEYWLSRSWIAHRARTKPSGFSGDYEMLIKLYDATTPARGLGGYLDLCMQDLPLARAVRTRLVAARQFLINETARRGHDLRILNVACGPCREYINWPATVGQGSVEIVALDNDPRALAWVDAHVTPGLPAKTRLQTTRYNALRLCSAATNTRKFGKFDIIYSIGLFDYLPDKQLVPILSALRDTLHSDGVMYIAFKDAARYDKTPYQWHLDWFFFQRSEEDCWNLFQSAGFDRSAMDLARDETGIILNFISQQKSKVVERIDLPENVLDRVRQYSPTVPSTTANH